MIDHIKDLYSVTGNAEHHLNGIKFIGNFFLKIEYKYTNIQIDSKISLPVHFKVLVMMV